MTTPGFLDDLMVRMTLDEKIGQLNLITPGGPSSTGAVVNENVEHKIRTGQVGGLFGTASVTVLSEFQKLAMEGSPHKIPLLFAMDVIHGHRTVFPIPLGLAASWDMELVEKTARVAATEAAADGIRQAYAPMIDVSRDPRWGRVAECPGEDPFVAARVAEAMVRGYQGTKGLDADDAVLACLKHFAAYGAAEGGRDYNNVDVSPRRMHDVYLAPFKAGVRAGAGSLMAAFNAVNGHPMHANGDLLTTVLREQWGFTGFVVSDYTGVSEMIDHGLGDLPTVSAAALNAGVDQDMVSEGYIQTLKRSVEEGRVPAAAIDAACCRMLEAKLALGLFDDPFRYLSEERAAARIMTPEHVALSRRAAAECCVLLKNDGALPLKRSGTIALVGPLADDHNNMLGTWAVSGDHSRSVPVLTGLRAGAPGATILHARGANLTDDVELARRLNVHGETVTIDPRPPRELIAEAVALAETADVVVAAVGEAREASGECSSRTDLSLSDGQKALLRALKATGKPLVVLLMSGRPLCLGEEAELADALLLGWFGGTEAGHGFADALFGAVNPGGKLTMTFPHTVGQIPVYHSREPTGRPYEPPEGGFAKFRSVYLDAPNDGLFPFGFGLSYTRFAYGSLTLGKTALKGEDDVLTVTVPVTNAGSVEGAEVVQLYLSDPVASLAQPIKRLIAYRKVTLAPGETAEVQFRVTTESLKFHKADSLTSVIHDWEPGEFILRAGPNSRDTAAERFVWEK
jgi:beta-glucosidase